MTYTEKQMNAFGGILPNLFSNKENNEYLLRYLMMETKHWAKVTQNIF